MPIMIELWQLIALIATTPLAFIGIYILFKKLAHLIMVRKGYMKLLFFTKNKMIREDLRKPQSDTFSIGNKAFELDSKNIFRWGHTPTLSFSENSTKSLNPLEKKSVLTPTRLDNIQFNAFNAGKRTIEKKEKIMQILLIIAVAAAIGALGFAFMDFQATGVMENRIIGSVRGIVVEEIAKINITNTTTPITVLT